MYFSFWNLSSAIDLPNFSNSLKSTRARHILLNNVRKSSALIFHLLSSSILINVNIHEELCIFLDSSLALIDKIAVIRESRQICRHHYRYILEIVN